MLDPLPVLQGIATLNVHPNRHDQLALLVGDQTRFEVESDVVVEGRGFLRPGHLGQVGVGEEQGFLSQIGQVMLVQPHGVDVQSGIGRRFAHRLHHPLDQGMGVVQEAHALVPLAQGDPLVEGQPLEGGDTQPGGDLLGQEHLIDAVGRWLDEGSHLPKVAQHEIGKLAHSAVKSSPSSASSYSRVRW